MTCGILFEKVEAGLSADNLYSTHIPPLGLTTRGEGVEDARAAAVDLAQIWLAEMRAAGEMVNPPAEIFFSTIEISEDALQAA